MMKPIPIVICGGHFSPAFAVVEMLRQKNKFSIHYIGRKKPLEGDGSCSLEYMTMVKWKIPFYPIITGRLQRSLSWYTVPSLAKFPIGIMQSFYYLMKIKPQLVLSFGGYVALPVCLASFIIRIPIVTHEQTFVLGLSNQIISRLAKITCLSWSDTKGVPSGVKTFNTGIPIRNAILSPKNGKVDDFGDRSLPLLYVTGGSLGARSINGVIGTIIPHLAKSFRIIHQCGWAAGDEDFVKLLQIKNSLPKSTEKNYRPVRNVEHFKIGEILSKAYLVISRAGANTVAEIAAVGVPAILIPLPWAAADEQGQNALILEKIGLAKIIKQKDLTGQILISNIDSIEKNYSNYNSARQRAKNLYTKEATFRIVKVIDLIIEERKKNIICE